tara:strand:+ start:330 stop:476 length:147 start_codon:yes stop_codon:yes gene_type:complete
VFDKKPRNFGQNQTGGYSTYSLGLNLDEGLETAMAPWKAENRVGHRGA